MVDSLEIPRIVDSFLLAFSIVDSFLLAFSLSVISVDILPFLGHRGLDLPYSVC